MPRAYLRIDPNLDQHPDPLGMLLLLCAGARQAERGHFRDRAVVVRTIGATRTKALIGRRDIVELADGRWYIEGWDEWQEGDYTVGERMKRMRARRKRSVSVTPATVPPSPSRNDVTTDASKEITSSESSSYGVGDEYSPPPQVGRREDKTNPRALGTNPRANGHSPRQEREAVKRGALPQSTYDILRRAAALGTET